MDPLKCFSDPSLSSRAALILLRFDLEEKTVWRIIKSQEQSGGGLTEKRWICEASEGQLKVSC